MTNKHSTFTLRRALFAEGPVAIPTPRNQSLHFVNRNPAKPVKTSHQENFNRYTFRVSGFVLANPEPKRDLRFLASVPLAAVAAPCFLASRSYSPHFLSPAEILITEPRLEMAAND
jgi:hypothetical protein